MVSENKLTIDSLVEDDLLNVRKVVSETKASDYSDQVAAIKGRPTLYSIVQNNLTNGTRLSTEHTRILSAYETALSIFRIVSREVRREMDVFGLEKKLSARKVYSFTPEPVVVDNREVDKDIPPNQTTISDQVETSDGIIPGESTIERLKRKQREAEQRSQNLQPLISSVASHIPKPAAYLREQRTTINTSSTQTYQQTDDNQNQELITEISDTIMFSNRYALHFAGLVGLKLLGEEINLDINHYAGFNELDNSKKRNELTAILTRLATGDLENELIQNPIGDDFSQEDSATYLRDVLAAHLTTWVNQFKESTWEPQLNNVSIKNLEIKFKDHSITAGAYSSKTIDVVVDQKFMNFRKKDVIGPGEFGDAVWNNLIKLAAYDHQRQENPMDPANVIFTYGPPGCGKTFLSHSYIQSFAELCRENDIPFWALTHSTTDYASSYQNQTANALNELAAQIRDFEGVVVMYVADADNIFQSRKSSNVTAEQQQTMGVYFKLFDGTLVPKNGKFMAIMDANYIDGIDDATKSRLFNKTIKMQRWEDPAHYAELSNRLVGKKNSIDQAGFDRIGQYLLDSNLSIREIGNVFNTLRGDMQVPDESLSWTYEQKIEFRDSQLDGITTERVISAIDDYVTTRMEIERASIEAKMSRDYDRFRTELGKVRSPSAQ